jgi:ribonucleoside-diphosphate reductase alpha chain
MEHDSVPPQSPNNPEELQRRIGELEQEIQALKEELEKAQANPHRKRLPSTRQSLTHKFAIGQHEGYMTVGMFDDGHPGEVFLTMAKEGSTIGGLMDTIGILTSLALQYGVPVETLAHKLEHVNFEPNGWTRDPTIRRASSVIDYIFRWLRLQFSETYRQEKTAGWQPQNVSTVSQPTTAEIVGNE